MRILSWVPITRSKLALLSLGKAWYAALTDPEVHPKDVWWNDMVPDPPRLQAAILAVIPGLRVQTRIE